MMILRLLKHLRDYDKRLSKERLLSLCQELFPSPIRMLLTPHPYTTSYNYRHENLLILDVTHIVLNECRLYIKKHSTTTRLFIVVVSSGGLLLHMYLNFASTPKTFKWWKTRRRKRGRDRELIPLNAIDMETLLKDNSSYFHGFVLQSLHMSGYNRSQLFYPTFAAACHGLSKMGMDMLAGYGYCSPHTSYQRQRTELCELAKNKVRYVLLEKDDSHIVLYGLRPFCVTRTTDVFVTKHRYDIFY